MLRLSVNELWSAEYREVTAHAPCHVTYYRGGGGKMDHILQILDLKSAQFMYSFRHDTPKIKPRYRRKIVFIPLCRLTTKLTVHA